MNKSFLVLLALLFSFHTADAKKKKHAVVELHGVVTRCHDGDTCRVQIDGVEKKIAKVRLAGIDTPELKQQYGPEARDFTQKLLGGKRVDLKCDGASWDRITCTVFLEQENANEAIVRGGWAYDSTKYSKGAYRTFEARARAQRIGMWADFDLTSPYCFRHKANKKCRISQNYMP